MIEIWKGIIIGAVGGAFAGLTVSIFHIWHNKWLDKKDKRRVYNWIEKYTSDGEKQYRSTRAIASWNNLTEDRVRYICSIDDRIYLSTGKKEDVWSIYGRGERSLSEKPDIR